MRYRICEPWWELSKAKKKSHGHEVIASNHEGISFYVTFPSSNENSTQKIAIVAHLNFH